MVFSGEALGQGRLLSTAKVMKKAQRDEFEHIALPHLSHLYTAAFYLTKGKTEAEDLVQETYLRAFRFFHNFQSGTNCRAWLLSILRNLFINRYQQKKREAGRVDWDKIDQVYESIVEQGEKAEEGNPEELLISKLMAVEMEKALKGLPEEHRMAVVLVDIEQLTYEEAAMVMTCPVGTVRSRVSRGRQMLQVALREYALDRGLLAE